MKKNKHPYWFILGIQLFLLQPVIGQQEDINETIETVTLFTDRTLFIAGEKIFYSGILTAQHEWPDQQSTVLYAELITPNGKHIAGSKNLLSQQKAEGYLLIPEETLTGNYYVRAYTKYMRNFGPDYYAYVQIKIVNPLRNDVLEGKDTTFTQRSSTYGPNAFKISLDKNGYTPDDSVKIWIEANAEGIQNKRLTIVSVAEVSVLSENYSELPSTKPAKPSHEYYPETRGVSLTGQLKDQGSGLPFAGARVNLSIIGQDRDFMAARTDINGRYYFSLPSFVGSRDLFICGETGNFAKPKILIDNDFCSIPVHLPSPSFTLSAAERKAATDMNRNYRISHHFDTDTPQCENENRYTERSFYGKASGSLIFDQFVQLPTIEEYFNELPSSVKIRKQGGHSFFKVLGTRAEMQYFDPLVLVDWVAINDPSIILSASPSNIERVEWVDVPYVKGDITYGGIVSIISRRRDFAGIDLPSSGIFLNYLFLHDTCNVMVENTNPLHPDDRNTIFWNPDISFGTNNFAQLSFKAPYSGGRYAVVLNVLNADGTVSRKQIDFEVREEDKD
jgi:hypothetical protein